MSENFKGISIERLLRWIIEEYQKQDQIFGINKELFFKPSDGDPFQMRRYQKLLETPLGVAAGPHTQMAQNIICAWLTGARYIELKTVQTLDRIEVSKPCIDMEDEGYNCEWSQELSIVESFHEYLNAWILIHVVKHMLGWEMVEEPGFIFNMSIGYDMKGILKKNVQYFLDKMKDCREEKEKKIDSLEAIYPDVRDIMIPDRISDNVTLSTMHGCPPEEIEKIGLYLIKDKNLHTTIKLNPTLLGPEQLRYILNNRLEYAVEVPDEAFDHDLKYPDALGIISRLRSAARECEVEFGIKLTNTLEVINKKEVFPEKEKMMYMSGRALHPISITLAAKLQEEFKGELDISFSAGVDCFNLPEVIGCGIRPVTMCSDILKPGGYTRLPQYIELLTEKMKEYDAFHIDDYIMAKARKIGSKKGLDAKDSALKNLLDYSGSVTEQDYYKKSFWGINSEKTSKALLYFDCIDAPCTDECAISQDVPGYLHHTAKGDYEKALEVILKANPFPQVTGMVCDHRCVTRCKRSNYDNPLMIREIKRFVLANTKKEPEVKPNPKNGLKVGIIGAGPSGLSCAWFLALEGFEVTVFEAKNIPGGMISDAIPLFRLRDDDIQKDITRIQSLGVTIRYNQRVDNQLYEKLKQSMNYVYIAVGAQVSRKMCIKGEDHPRVIDALGFLSKVRQKKNVPLGNVVAVIGGGNSAVDAARTAWRVIGETGAQGRVTVLYRRTQNEMPADPEEVRELVEEGIELLELTSVVEISEEDNKLNLSCFRMKFGDKDETGRKRPIIIENSNFNLCVETVIYAVGQQIDMDFIGNTDIQPDPQSCKTKIPDVFLGGDALRGPSTLIKAIGDGKRVAWEIIERSSGKSEVNRRGELKDLNLSYYQKKLAQRQFGVAPIEVSPKNRKNFNLVTSTLSEDAARKEASRCLQCSDVCHICVSVCPNRANVGYPITPVHYQLQKAMFSNGNPEIKEHGIFSVSQPYQVLNIVEFCNGCGNCRTFCPALGAPFQEKPRLCLTESSFENEKDKELGSESFFFNQEGGILFLKFKGKGKKATLHVEKDEYIYNADHVQAHLDKNSLRIKQIDLKIPGISEITFESVATMAVLYENLGLLQL